MRARIFFAAMAITLGASTAVVADSAFTFAFGASTFDLDKLETQLGDNGYAPRLDVGDVLSGFSCYRLTEGGLVLGIEMQGGRQSVFSDSARAEVSVSTFVLQVGRTVHRTARVRVYPLIGIGSSGTRVHLTRRAARPGFDEAVRPVFRESRLSAGSMTVQLAVGADYHLPASRHGRGRSGLLLGVRMGYNLRPTDPRWQMEKEDVLGGPEIDSAGPFFRILIGYGRMGRAAPE